MERILDAGCGDGVDAVMLAMGLGHPRLLQLLLEAGASTADIQGSPLLCLAAGTTAEYEELISVLLRFGLDPNGVDTNGNNPVVCAASNHHHISIGAVKRLLEAGADPDFGSAVASHVADPACPVLLSSTDDQDDRQVVHWTPVNALAWALTIDSATLVETLLAFGADPRRHGVMVTILRDGLSTRASLSVIEYAQKHCEEDLIDLLNTAAAKLQAGDDWRAMEARTEPPTLPAAWRPRL